MPCSLLSGYAKPTVPEKFPKASTVDEPAIHTLVTEKSEAAAVRETKIAINSDA